MRILYQISVLLYSFVIKLASFFHPKAKLWVDGRKNPEWKKFNACGNDVVWFHCASLGEFDIALPLIEKWQLRNPKDEIVVTFFSPSGMENHYKRNHSIKHVFYIPLDTLKNAKEFVQKINPKNVVFVKYEFWAFHLFEAKKHEAKIYSVNTLFRKNQLYFKWFGGFYKKILLSFDHFFVQNENSIELLKSINIHNASVAGDIRFDRVSENKNAVSSSPIVEKWLNQEKAFIMGSSWPVDEKMIFPFINSDRFEQKVIIAPHEINDDHIREIENRLQKKSIRYTEIQDEIPLENQVLILNTIGHLTNSFQHGEIAYVGGGFTGKLHNILEPAVFGLPILLGPKHKKFPEAQLFIEKGFAFEVSDTNSFQIKFDLISENKAEIKKRLIQFMENQVGVSEKIINQINSH